MLVAAAIEKSLSENLSAAFVVFLVAAMASWIAYTRNFFRVPTAPPIWSGAIPLVDVFGAFLIFVGMQLIIVPLFVYIGVWIYFGAFVDVASVGLSSTVQGWANLAGIVLTAFALVGYAHLLGKDRVIWNRLHKLPRQLFRDMGLGVLIWFVGYPLVIAMSEFLSTIIVQIFGHPPVDQAAVRYMKELIGQPVLFWLTGLAMITLIPVTEELLFRGFLQNWLVGRFGRIAGICTAALVFALFHMSASQGIHNIDLVVSLFILAGFLGFLYERQQTLWAPIALHATFNAFSLGMLYAGTVS